MTIQVLGMPRTSASHEHSSIGQSVMFFGKWLRARDELLTATGNPTDLPVRADWLHAALFRPVLAVARAAMRVRFALLNVFRSRV